MTNGEVNHQRSHRHLCPFEAVTLRAGERLRAESLADVLLDADPHYAAQPSPIGASRGDRHPARARLDDSVDRMEGGNSRPIEALTKINYWLGPA